MSHLQKTSYFIGMFFLLMAFCILVSLPMLQAGYFSDDIINSLIPGDIAMREQDFWTFVLTSMQNWLASGRLFPVSIISSISVFNLVPDEHHYQMVRSVFIWASVFSFAWLLKTVSKDIAASILFIFLLPLCWSIRDAAEPLTSFAIFLPLVTLFITFTQLFYLKYKSSAQQVWLGLSLIMFVCALCTYEVGIIAYTLLFTLMVCTPGKIIKDIKPYSIILVAYLIVNLYLYSVSKNVYDGIQINFSGKFWSAFAAQFTAALPLSYWLFATKHALTQLPNAFSMQSLPQDILFIIAAISIYQLLTKLALSRQSVKNIFFIGLNLTLMPALLIGISQKYQALVQMGVGYIPVYLQYFGMACLLLFILGLITFIRMHIYLRRLVYLLLALSLSGVITFATSLNYLTVHILNEKFSDKRVLVEMALHHQVLATVPDHAYLVEKMYLWNTPDFYWQNANKKLAGVIDIYDGTLMSTLNKYLIVTYQLPHSRSGYVMVGPMFDAQLTELKNNDMVQTIYLSHPRIFITATDPWQLKLIWQRLQWQLSLSPQIINTISTAYLAHHQDWFITTLPDGDYPMATSFESIH
jgi:hypothetical protein